MVKWVDTRTPEIRPMWLLLPDSFTSAVVSRTRDRLDPDRVVVRSRLKEHLSVLIQRHPETLGGATIIETPHSDYRWRIVVPKARWAEVVTAEVSALDYDNFKNAAARRSGPLSAFVHSLHDIWSILWRLQK